MELLGGVSAIIALAHLTKKLGVASHGFFGRMKDCPNGIRNIEDELFAISGFLEKIADAFRTPAGGGKLSLQGKEQEFERTIGGLRRVCEELGQHIEKYEAEPRSWKAKKGSAKWATHGETEALKMSGTLASYKQTLSLTLNMTTADTTARMEEIVIGIAKSQVRMELKMEEMVTAQLNAGRGVQRGDLRVEEARQIEGWLQRMVLAATPAIPQAGFDNTPTNGSRPQFESRSAQLNRAAVDQNGYYNVPTTPTPMSNSQQFVSNSLSEPPAAYKARPGSSMSGTTIEQDDESMSRHPDDPTVVVDGVKHKNSMDFLISVFDAPKEKQDDFLKRHPEFTNTEEGHWARLAKQARIAERERLKQQSKQSPQAEKSEWPGANVEDEPDSTPIHGIPMLPVTDRGGFFKRMFTKDTRTQAQKENDDYVAAGY